MFFLKINVFSHVFSTHYCEFDYVFFVSAPPPYLPEALVVVTCVACADQSNIVLDIHERSRSALAAPIEVRFCFDRGSLCGKI